MIHSRAVVQVFSIVLFSIYLSGQLSQAFYERPGVSAREIIEARGYLAQEHEIVTQDGYKLRLTRATNPLINGGKRGLANRDPILFIHGILEDSAVFLINSLELKGPSDFSGRNLTSVNGTESLAAEPSARSLAFLAMDFGHEIWLLSRRGFPGSQQKVRSNGGFGLSPEQPDSYLEAEHTLRVAEEWTASQADFLGAQFDYPLANGFTLGRRFRLNPFLALPGALLDFNLASNVLFSFDRDFWNFSFDEQARYDVPEAVDYILAETKRSKVATVTHSAGGAILLMALSSRPELAAKLSNNVLWAQGFSLGHGDAFDGLLPAKTFLETYTGSVPPSFSTLPAQAILGAFCAVPLAPGTLCEFVSDFLLGASGGQQPIYPEFLNVLLYPTSSHEFAQNLQNVVLGKRMHFYDYGPNGNRLVYNGATRPPAYDTNTINATSLSFYAGVSDSLVSSRDVEATLALLKVPYKYKLIGPKFNHQGYFYHEDNARLAVVPALVDLQAKQR